MMKRPLFLLLALSVPLTVAQLGAQPAKTLKEAAAGKFLIGAAINDNVYFGRNRKAAAIVEREFNTISPENCLKWEVIHPEPDKYDFAAADRYVEFGVKHHDFIVGHTFMWHYQTPPWVFENPDHSPKNAEQLLKELREHIKTVVSRYKGRVNGWDVVNEAIDDQGNLRTDKPWYKALGENGIIEAFRAAHEADPGAELYYNEYSLWYPKKRDTVIKLVNAIRAAGIRVDAVGMQEHYLAGDPTPAQVAETIEVFAKAGIPVQVTELDVSVLPRPDNYAGADLARITANADKYDAYRKVLPAEVQAKLTGYYAEIFQVYRSHAAAIKRVTFWGISDAESWLNGWPIPGRTDYPLLYDRKYRPKPAFDAVLKALSDN